ncbi:MAG TPA: YwiC-like family protein [Acidimicrobiales bacterium]|nr:YwiC-like family protein [Acidimicrobiales bacterium]
MSGPADTRLPVEPAARSALRAVAIPSEHGGWGLTLEPALLGMLVSPSLAGVALALAAFVAFVARTPLKVVLVDHWRHHVRDRTKIASRVLAIELVLLAGLVAVAIAVAHATFLWPFAFAAPLVVVELWFDMRSRSRRLIPELAGAVGIAAVAAMIILADGADTRLAVGLWLLLGARGITAIPYVRAQIARLHHRARRARTLAVADATSVVVAGSAVVLDAELGLGALAVAAVIVAQRVWARRPVPTAKVLGLRQMGLGLAVVAVTAVGVHIL